MKQPFLSLRYRIRMLTWRGVLERYGAIPTMCPNCKRTVAAYPDSITMCLFCDGDIPGRIRRTVGPFVTKEMPSVTLFGFHVSLRPREVAEFKGEVGISL